MTVTNPYYEFDPEFTPGTKARSDAVNLQLQAIQNAFDFFPGSADALTTGTSTFGPESGAGNAYVVTMPDTRLAEQDGDEVIFFATHTNTGAATLNVDGLGAKTIVRADGTAVSANDLQSGLLYVLRYDATNTRYQLVGPSTSYLTDATAAAAASAASAAAALVSEGAASDSAALAQQWAVHPEDDDVDGYPGQYSAFHWAQKALGAAGLQRIVGDIATATPPTTEAVTGLLEYYDSDETDILAQVGFNGSNAFVIANRMHGGSVVLSQEDSIGTPQTVVWDGSSFTVNAPLFILEQAAAEIDVASYGQFWVRNDSPNIPMFTDDAGTDYILNEASPTSPMVDGWNFDTLAAMADPGTGEVRFSGASPSATSNIAFSNTAEFSGLSPAQVFGRLYAGCQLVASTDDRASFSHFTITSITDNTTWWNIGVDYRSGNNVLPGALDLVTFEFYPTANVEGGTEASSLSDILYWEGATNRWEASGTSIRINPSSPPTGGRLQLGTTLTSTVTQPHIQMNIGATTGVPFFIQSSASSQGFYASADFNASPDNFTWGNRLASVNTNLYGITADNELRVYSGAAFLIQEKAAAATDVAAYGQFWVRNDTPNTPMFTDDTGVDFELNSSGGFITADINTATPPTTEAVTANLEFYDLAEDDLLATIGFDGSNVLQFKNKMHSGGFAFTGEKITSGTEATILTGDPDAGVELYYSGFRRAHAAGTGDFWVYKDDSLVNGLNMPIINFGYQNDTIIGEVGYDANSLVLRSRVNGQSVVVQAWSIGGAQTNCANFSSQDQVLRYSGTEVFRTVTSGIYVTGGVIKLPHITTAGNGNTNEGSYWVKNNANTTLAMFTAENAAGSYTLQNTISEFSSDFSTTTTAADPGTGTFRLDNTSYGAVTELYISSYDSALPYTGSASSNNNNDWAWGLAAVGDLVTIRSAYDPRRWIQALITSITDNGTWHTVGLNILTSGSLFMLTQDNCRFHIQHLSRAPGSATPDTLYYNNTTPRVVALVGHNMALRSDTSLDTTNRLLQFQHQDGTVRGDIGHAGGPTMSWTNQIHGGAISITAEDAGGTQRTILSADPDSDTTLRADVDLRLEVAAGETALLANADGSVVLYYDNTSAMATQQLGATGVTSGGNIKDHAGNLRDIGFNVLRTFNFNATDTLEAQHCGHATGKDDTASYTLTGPADTDVDFPVGGVTHVWNLGSSVDYTISDTASCTMYFCDGSAAPVDIVGSGTLAPGGMVTLWRYSTTAIYITGSGFTA